MFNWGSHLIQVVPNFATDQELSVLNDYLYSLPDFEFKSVSWLEFIAGEHETQIKIEDENVRQAMIDLDNRVHRYIVENYFPNSELKIIKDKGRRQLELIRWRQNASLPAHSDWRKADGLPYPLTLPAYTVGTLVYLNKDYSGGEINFPDYSFKLDPKPGDLILFPCQYMHEVCKVSPIDGKDKASRHTMPTFYWFDLEPSL